MRLQEVADAEEQIKLWKLISDSVLHSIKLQAIEQELPLAPIVNSFCTFISFTTIAFSLQLKDSSHKYLPLHSKSKKIRMVVLRAKIQEQA